MITTYEQNSKDVPVIPLSKLSNKVGWYRDYSLLLDKRSFFMNEKEIKRTMFELKYKIALLQPEEREKIEPELKKELDELRKLYFNLLMEEKSKEKDENGKYKKQ